MTDTLLALVDWLQANPAISAPAYVLLFGLIMAVGIPGGWILLLSGGWLFGWPLGSLLATGGVALAAYLTRQAIRTAFGRWLDERAGGWQASVRNFVESGNTALLLLPRLIPVVPFFALNAGVSATGIPLQTYLWTTTLGTFPIVVLVSRMGAQLGQLEDFSRAGVTQLLWSPGLLVPLAALVVLTLVAWWYIRSRSQALPVVEPD
jgi:uncharacterized membrane protein YdjX (TVP38/TMEM64 family)